MNVGGSKRSNGLVVVGLMIFIASVLAFCVQHFSGAGKPSKLLSRHAASIFFAGATGAAGLKDPLRLLTWELTPNPAGGTIGHLLSIGPNGRDELLKKVNKEPKGRCWLPWAKNTTHLYYSCTTSDTDEDHEFPGRVCVFDRKRRTEDRCFEVMGLSHDVTWSNRLNLFLIATTKLEECDARQPKHVLEGCEAINRTKVKFDVMKAYDEHGNYQWSFDTRNLLGETFQWKFQITTPDRLEATHINAQLFSSVEDSFYLSSRGLSTLYKINTKTQQVIWGVGLHGTVPIRDIDGELLKTAAPFLGQHGVAILPGEVVVTFDNGVYPPSNRQNPSRLVAFTVNNNEARILWRYAPEQLAGKSSGKYDRAVTGSAAPLPAVFGSATAAFGPVEPPTVIPPSRKFIMGTHNGNALFVSNLDCWFVYGATATMDAPMVRVARLSAIPLDAQVVHQGAGYHANASVFVAVVVPYYDCQKFSVVVTECQGEGSTILSATVSAAAYWQTSLVRLPMLPEARVRVQVVVEATTVEVVWDGATHEEVEKC